MIGEMLKKRVPNKKNYFFRFGITLYLSNQRPDRENRVGYIKYLKTKMCTCHARILTSEKVVFERDNCNI